MRKLLTYLVIGLIFLGACNKQLPPEEKSEAVFYVKGNLGGKSINVRAGDNQVYMLPRFEDDSLGIRSFTGIIGNVGCVGDVSCPGQIRISIREKEIGSEGRASIEQNLQVQNYQFRGQPEYLFTSYKATFISRSTPSSVTHIWDFGDGTNSNDINPVHYYLRESDSVVTTSLWVSSNGCNNSVSYETRFLAPCDVDFTPKRNNNGGISWSPKPKVDRRELWDLTNGYLPLDGNNLFPDTDSIFTACVQSTDTITGCVSYKCKNVVLDTQLVNCVANYDVVKETIVSEDVRDYSEATISWENEQGKKYSSIKYAQPDWANFNIVSLDDYLMDNQGNPTKRVTVYFRVRLYGDSESDYMDFQSDESVFAISY